MVDDPKAEKNPTAPTIVFDYIKSSSFRCVRADGVVGGITPHGYIHMAFFSERPAIPRRVIHELQEDGNIGEIRDMETRNSIIREMDTDVFITLDAAKNLHTWLAQQIEEFENLLKKGK